MLLPGGRSRCVEEVLPAVRTPLCSFWPQCLQTLCMNTKIAGDLNGSRQVHGGAPCHMQWHGGYYMFMQPRAMVIDPLCATGAPLLPSSVRGSARHNLLNHDTQNSESCGTTRCSSYQPGCLVTMGKYLLVTHVNMYCG
eukprot:4452520-Amphidinium_carterae.1